jgi:hypothetical protein
MHWHIHSVLTTLTAQASTAPAANYNNNSLSIDSMLIPKIGACLAVAITRLHTAHTAFATQRQPVRQTLLHSHPMLLFLVYIIMQVTCCCSLLQVLLLQLIFCNWAQSDWGSKVNPAMQRPQHPAQC